MRIINLRDEKIGDAVYIGRGSKWGNPFIMKSEKDRADVIKKYRAYILSKFDRLEIRRQLKNRDLACYCWPKACHGDILKEICEE